MFVMDGSAGEPGLMRKLSVNTLATVIPEMKFSWFILFHT
jgi:hypothetical protein